MSVFKAPSDTADTILGVWWTEGKKAKVKIYKEAGRYAGEIIWLKASADDDRIIRDSKNEIERLKERPLIGIDLIEGFTFKDSKWVEGKVYDPEKGKSYDCILKLDGDQLEVRGYINMPMFGKSVFWKRVNEAE
ncbi:hypothetical protein AWN68_10650 [Roseivirga echinicomitans]|uniref:DUF2147 domain-containing protein n=2 Tax=Roseivirga echinicomitans TaxID=296218 RepID=A0A150X357_9BACT|nr:hypothetical protein AWN68_10650 [Roseivirga echinicomitans]